MNRADLQSIVDDVIAGADVTDDALVAEADVSAIGATIADRLRVAGATLSDIEFWIADSAQAAVRAGGVEGQRRIECLSRLALGMGFVVAVDHGDRRILVRPIAMRMH